MKMGVMDESVASETGVAPTPLETTGPMGGTVAASEAPHCPSEQLDHLHLCIHAHPSWTEMILLAFQHYIVMLGSTVMISTILVPKMGGNNGDKARVIQTLLFMSGLNTLLQTLIGTRLPTVMNASFTFIIPVLSIINDFNAGSFSNEHERFVQTIRAIQGSLIISSFVNIIIGYSGTWGTYSRFFTTVVITPVVCLAGLGQFERGFPEVGKCIEIGLPMLVLLVVSQKYLKNIHERAHSLMERFGLLFSILVIWCFTAILTGSGAYKRVPEKTKQHCHIDRSHLTASAPWIRIPYPFQWGTPIFSASHVFGMMGAVLDSAAKSTGTFYAAARFSGVKRPPAHVLSRSIGLQGVGLLLEGLFGAVVGSTASVENVGLLGLTSVRSRRAVQISTIFMIFFSIFGKFGAFFASIPLPIFAAIHCVLFGLVSGVGVSFMQCANYNSVRNLYILGLTLFLGISVPQYFNDFSNSAGHGPVKTGAGWFNEIFNSIFSSPPTVALIVGTVLDNTLDATPTAVDQGLRSSAPSQPGTGDVPTEEFYSYPFNINMHISFPTRFFYIPTIFLHIPTRFRYYC